jgi:putative membrane protein
LAVSFWTAQCMANETNNKTGWKRFIQSWLINTLAVLVAVNVLKGIQFTDKSLLTPFLTSLVLGILNAFIRPIMMLMALPLLIFTLGLFTLVINALLLMLVAAILPQFEVDSFWWALLGSLLISIISLALNTLTGVSRARITVQRQHRPPGGNDPGGSGPVIDV